MTRTEAAEFIRSLLGDDTPPDAVLDQLIDGAAMPDASGVIPGEPGWVQTFDEWWAAADAALMAASLAGDTLTSVTSEGSTFQVQGRDWQAVATAWRSRSTIGRLTGPHVIDVPGYPVYGPTSDGVRGLNSLDWS